jgi:UDP-glucose 4-epimerase
MPKQRVIITGATGFVGSYVVREFISRGIDVIGADLVSDPALINRLTTGHQRKLLTLITGDIRDRVFVDGLVGTEGVTAVVHLASTLSRSANRNPRLAIDVICGGATNVFDAAVKARVKRVAWASTAAIFGRSDGATGPAANDTVPTPTDIYGKAKSLNETIGSYYNRHEGLETVGLRFTVVYGYGRATALSRGSAGGPIVDMIEKPALGERVDPVRFGDDVMDWLHVTDAAHAVYLAATAPMVTSPALNVVGFRATFRTAVEEILAVIPEAGIVVEAGTSPRPLEMNLDGSTTRHEIGYSPSMDLRTGIRQYIEAVRAQRD